MMKEVSSDRISLAAEMARVDGEVNWSYACCVYRHQASRAQCGAPSEMAIKNGLPAAYWLPRRLLNVGPEQRYRSLPGQACERKKADRKMNAYYH